MGIDHKFVEAAKKWCENINMEFEGIENRRRGEGYNVLATDARGRTWHVPCYIINREEENQVDHPSHYNKEGKKECIDEMVDKYGIEDVVKWCIITADKYLYRAGLKSGNSSEQDLKKAEWYLKWAFTHGIPSNYMDKFDELWSSTLNSLIVLANG